MDGEVLTNGKAAAKQLQHQRKAAVHRFVFCLCPWSHFSFSLLFHADINHKYKQYCKIGGHYFFCNQLLQMCMTCFTQKWLGNEWTALIKPVYKYYRLEKVWTNVLDENSKFPAWIIGKFDTNYLDFEWPMRLGQTWPSSNLPLFLHELPPPLLAALRWTPVHSKKQHVHQLASSNPIQNK